MIIFLREKFIAQIFMWVIAVVFVIATFLLYSGSSGPQQSGAEGEVVIKIGAFELTRGAFERLVSNQLQAEQQNQRFTQNREPKDVQKDIIDFYIKRVIEGSAKITKAEIEHYIRSDENLVNYYNQANPDAAEEIKNSDLFNLSATSLRDSIRELELVTDTEVEQDFRLESEKAKVKFIEFPHSDYTDLVKVDDNEAKTYYQENKERYKTEEQVNVKFIQINPADFVSQEDIVKYYTDNQNEFLDPEIPIVKARHILKKFPDDATDEQKAETKAAAEEMLKTVKEGLAAGTSFADLAKEHSEGPSGVEGGALRGRNPKLPPGDYFARGDMVKPFEEACFDTLNPGDVSDLIETSFGFHIIKLEERKEPTPQTFTQVENEIRAKLNQINGVDGAERIADNLVFEIELEDYETAVGKEVYKDLSLEAVETGFFSKGKGSIPNIGSTSFTYRGLADELFDMQVGVTKKVETKNYSGDVSAFFVVTVLGKKPPTIPDYESVKDQVKDDLQTEKSKELALAAAQDLINQRTDNALLDDLVKTYKVPEGKDTEEKTVQESNLFSLSDDYNVSGMGISKDAMFAAFDLSVGDVRGPYQGYNAAYIIELTEQDETVLDDIDDTEKLKRQQTLLNQKKGKAYDSWLAARENGIEIWIHEDYR
ncbi:hypothetical protein F4225_13155 [Candidatus Poribacteria bacterium]|nr:hypothetical protein [Candidatus Poribacteria bacterium]